MKCDKCGTEVNEKDKFCPNCGSKIIVETVIENQKKYKENILPENENRNRIII